MYLRECITHEQVVNIINNEDFYSGDLESHEIAGLHAAEAAQESGYLPREEAEEVDMTQEEYSFYSLESHLLCLVDAGADFDWTSAVTFGLSKLARSNPNLRPVR